MIKKSALVFLILFCLTGCNRGGHSSTFFGSSGIGFQYDDPGNYDFCGTDSHPYGFDMYCFTDFDAMRRCEYEDVERKPYSECNYQGHISVTIESRDAYDNALPPLAAVLEARYPVENPEIIPLQRDEDIVVAKVPATAGDDGPEAPTLIAVLPFSSDHIAIIEGSSQEPDLTDQFQEAFATVAATFEAFHIRDHDDGFDTPAGAP